MKISKQMLEAKALSPIDKAQLNAYKKLKSGNHYAVIYGYQLDRNKPVYFTIPIIKNSQEEIKEFQKAFNVKNKANNITLYVFYHDKLGFIEMGLRDNGLIEECEPKLEEAAETEFDVIFSDGPTSNRSERIIIKAKDVDDATSKAYNMPQAKKYSNVIVGERTVGKTNYIVAFNYTIIDSKGNEVKQPFKNEGRIVIEADSEAQAKSVYNKKCFGKYFNGFDFRPGTEIIDKPIPGKQCGKFGRVFDCYQGGVIPRFKADEALIIEETVDKDDEYYIKAGIIETGTDVEENLEEAIEPNGPIKYSFNVKKNAGEDTPQASGEKREYRNDDYYGFTDEVKAEIEQLHTSRALDKILSVISGNASKFVRSSPIIKVDGEEYNPDKHKDWKLDKQYKIDSVFYSVGAKAWSGGHHPGKLIISISKKDKKEEELTSSMTITEALKHLRNHK